MNRRLVALGLVAALELGACGSAGQSPLPSHRPHDTNRPGETDVPAPNETEVPDTNLVPQDVLGHYRISAPASWRVNQNSSGQVIATDGATTITVWPFFTTETSFGSQGAASALEQWATEVAPDATFSTVTPTASGIRARGTTSSGAEALALVNWTAVSRGTSGTAAIVEAIDLSTVAPTVAAVLASFRAEGAPVEDEPGAALDFTTWRDPSEGAFTADVPSGWTVNGGVVRTSLLVQSYVIATSPDSAIEMIMGDAFGYFVEPGSVLSFSGLGEGDTYTAPDGSQWPIRTYRPGATFLTDVFFPATGQDVEVTKVTDRPDIAGAIPTLGINDFAAGEVEYTFGNRIGQAMVVTERVQIAVGSSWHPWRLVLVNAPSDRTAEAAQAVTRLVSSFAIDQDWATMQAELTAAQTQILAEQNDAVSSIISDGYWGRQAVYDALSVRRERATLEVVDLTDGDGNTYRVDAGSDYYWIGSDGTVVGTDTAAAPDVDYNALLELP